MKATFLSSKGLCAWLRSHLREASVLSTARYQEKCDKALIVHQTQLTAERLKQLAAVTKLKTL